MNTLLQVQNQKYHTRENHFPSLAGHTISDEVQCHWPSWSHWYLLAILTPFLLGNFSATPPHCKSWEQI